MEVAQQRRSLEELRERAKLAIGDDKLIMIARHSTPSAAYDRAIMNNASEKPAQACRWLAVIRRDYGEEAFEQTVQVR